MKAHDGILDPDAIAKPTGSCTASRAAPGRTSSTCAPGSRTGEERMTATVEFFFDVGSPTTYLAWTQLPSSPPTAGAAIVWRPMLLGAVFKAAGNASPVTVPAKGRWMLQDMARHAPALRRALRDESALPDQYADADARRGGDRRCASRIGWRPTWLRCSTRCGAAAEPGRSGRSSPRRCSEAGFDADGDGGAGRRPRGQGAAAWRHTEEAVARGVFGAPTFFVGEAMFFGQDRLEFVREALMPMDRLSP